MQGYTESLGVFQPTPLVVSAFVSSRGKDGMHEGAGKGDGTSGIPH